MHIAHPCSTAQSRKTRALFVAAVLVAALGALIAVARGSAASTGTQVKVSKTALGRILADAKGRTLYMFAADKNGRSACYGKCATFWPPLVTGSPRVAGVGVKESLLGTTMRTDGKLQVTYDGHPLYRFLKDTKPGQINGQGLNASGGLWWAMAPAGTVIRHAAATNTPPPAAAGGGYGAG